MSDEPHNRKRKVRRGEDVSEREHAEETLQTTLQRLRALVSSMHGSVLLVAEDRVELANQAFCDYFGLKDAPADLVGLTAARMIQRIKNAYLDPDNQTSRIAEIVRRGRPVTGEEIAMRDGRVCLRDFVPISVDGTSHGRLWYHVDITERKQAEKALHESEERYRTLLESAPDAILVHRNGELLYANPVAVALYGASSLQELSQHNILDLVPSGEAHLAVERTKKVQSGRKLPIREGRIVRLDGREVPVEVVSSPVEYRGGTAAQAMIRDTTDRKRAHAEIESLARFPGENPNPVLRVSRYGVLMYANQASQAWLEDWGCAVGEMAPEVLRSLVDKAFAKRRAKQITVDIGLYGQIWAFQIVPIASAGYANVYGRDITTRRRAEDALRFQAHLLESVQDAVIATDAQDNVTFWNRTAEKLFGWTANEALGRPRTEVAGHTSRDAETIWTHVQSGKAWSGEHHHQRRDGTVFAASCTISPILNQSGQVAGALSVILDITERKRVEEALRESESNYRRIVETAQEGIMTADTEGVVTFANAKMAEMLGYSVKELIGKPGASLTDPSDATAVAATAARIEKGRSGQSEHYEARWLRKDGSELWVYASGTPIYDFNGNHIGNLAMCADITDRKQADDALRESEADLARAQAVGHIGSWRLDVQRNILNWSAESYRMFGIPPGTPLTYEAFLACVHPEDREAVGGAWQAALSGKPYSIDHRSIVGGDVRWIHEQAELEFDESGRLLGGFGTCQDITERRQAEEALRESEERLRLAQSSAKVGVWDWDIGRDVLSFTPELNEIYGLPPGTIKTYDDWRSLAHPDDIERVEAERDQAIAEHQPFDLEFRILHNSGEIRWISAMGSAAYDDSGRPIRVLGVNIDVTERKRAEEALRESEERFKVIATHTPDHILVQDRDLRYTWVLNPQLGLTVEGMIGKTDSDFLPKEDAANLTTVKRRVLETGTPEYVSAPLTSRGGGTEYFEGSYVPTHDSTGQVGGLIGYFKNVTARVMAEETLRLQANALQAAANGIVITDPHGQIQWVNGAFTRLTGYSVEEATGQNPRVLKSGQHDKTFYDKLWKTILAGRVWQGEIVNKRKDGRLYTEEMTITPVRDDAGQTAHFIAIKQDVTERKRLEAELERTRTEFLGEVSHELKTPLTAIKGCAAMALSAPVPPDAAETRELFDIIDAQANRLTDLVANLLDVTRIEGRRLSIEPTATDLAGIVEEARVIFEHSQYPHPLEVMLPRELPVLRADARRVVQVLTNLFTNAAKYSAPTTPIIVTAEKGEGVVTVHVRDAGVGIAAEKMPLLFRKFVQVQERGVKGTGLGLFICKGIVEAHGGRIWAESDGKGKGTVFSFTLPAVAGKMAPKHKGVAAGRGGVGRRTAERPFRIVAVDDEPDILHYIEHCLRSANCEVISTSDPLAAAELVRFHAPDIVLLDMRMPGMSGLEVLEEIRKFCQTPVTFITATQNREDVVRGREFGGTTWLEKPFSPQQLLDHVGLVLARRRRR